jgi:purine-binding chemotaxis protein CheW
MAEDKQFCTFLLDGLLFGVEVQEVQEVIRYQKVTHVPLAPPVIQGLINLRGQIVTAIDLRARLELPPLPEDRRPMNVVVRTGEDVISLLVDEIGDVVNVQEETFERPPETLTGLSRQLIRGAYKLEDRLLLNLDTQKAVRIHEDYDSA